MVQVNRASRSVLTSAEFAAEIERCIQNGIDPPALIVGGVAVNIKDPQAAASVAQAVRESGALWQEKGR